MSHTTGLLGGFARTPAQSPGRRRRLTVLRATLWCAVALTAAMAGCAAYQREPLNPGSDLERVQQKTRGAVTVSVAILTDEQSRSHFGVDLGRDGVQALWISVRNGSDDGYWLLRNAVDPDFFSPDEVALITRRQVPRGDRARHEQALRDESILVFLQPRTVTEGFMFLPRVEGGRYVDVRLLSDAYQARAAGGRKPHAMQDLHFGFAVPLPDGIFDYEVLDTAHVYDDRELPDLDIGEFRDAVESLPCCATNADGDRNGDPLNVVIVGDGSNVLNSLSRSGWSFTHRITFESVQRLISATLNNASYPVAPVSNLFLFGRNQDFALQRARSLIARRNHMRFWLAPFLFEGRQVWVGQVSRDIGIKVTPKAPTLTTHIIDPEVDLTREYLLHSLMAEGFVDRFGFAEGAVEASRLEPAYNLTDDPYFSDGLRLVVMLAPHPIPYSEVRSLGWERSAAPMAESQTRSAHRFVRPIGEQRQQQ